MFMGIKKQQQHNSVTDITNNILNVVCGEQQAQISPILELYYNQV